MDIIGNEQSFAHQLRKLRERSGKTLRELQETTFVSDSALSRYLSGRTLPPWSTVVTICTHFGVEATRLRPAWERARIQRRRTGLTAQPARDRRTEIYAEVTNSLTMISNDVASAITTLQSNGGPVPELLLRAQQVSDEAGAQLRALREMSSLADE